MDDHIPDLRLCKKRNLNVQLVLPKHKSFNLIGGVHRVVININKDQY